MTKEKNRIPTKEEKDNRTGQLNPENPKYKKARKGNRPKKKK